MECGSGDFHGYSVGFNRIPLPVLSMPDGASRDSPPVAAALSNESTGCLDRHRLAGFSEISPHYASRPTARGRFRVLPCRNEECQRMLQKLGATEYEIEVLKLHYGELQKEMKTEMASWKQILHDKDEHTEQWKAKCVAAEEQCAKSKQSLENLENYVGYLPTAEEAARLQSDLKHTTAAKNAEIAANKELRSQVRTLRNTVQDKDCRIMALEQKVSDLQQTLKSSVRYCTEISETVGASLSDLDGGDETTAVLQRNVTESKRHVMDTYQKMQKVVEARYQYFQGCAAKHHKDVQELRRRLEHEEDTTTALKSATAAQEDTVRLLMQRLQRASQEKQALMEEKLILEGELGMLADETACTDETKNLLRLLVGDGRKCFAELKGLVTACLRLSEGNDPELTHLLGLHDETILDDPRDDSQQLKGFLKEIGALRRDVEKLRSRVVDRYAEEISRSTPCILQ